MTQNRAGKNNLKRVVLIVLDSVGVGYLPDAANYGDVGANTLGHIAEKMGGLKMPHLQSMGLGNIIPLTGIPETKTPTAAYGKMAERSAGKDTTTGHWEIAGVILEKPFSTYPQGFPAELMQEYEKLIGRKTLGNVVASGTEIIKELGEEHIKTGFPIVYTSADSVFQIAAHEEVIPLEELYRFCRIARDLLKGEHAVGRVIARPFIGKPGAFERTPNRHDFSLAPTGPTLLDRVAEKGLAVESIGKISDIFAGRGVTGQHPVKSNADGITQLLMVMDEAGPGLIFINQVDFDSQYGHRNDWEGYGAALEAFDRRVPDILGKLRDDDVLLITADHGCDPVHPGTDHTREYVPLLVYGKAVKPVNVGVRKSYADLGATVAEILGVTLENGESFWKDIYRGQANAIKNPSAKIKETLDFLLGKAGVKPRIGIILGSGLGGFTEKISGPIAVPYEAIPNFPVSTVKGHSGQLVFGQIEGQPVVAMQGRFHYYEGYTMSEVTFPVRVMREMGVEILIVTNAAGGVNADFRAGDLMIIADHINLMGTNPLLGPNEDEWGPRFPDMTEAYNLELRGLLKNVGEKLNIPLREGVYVGLSGPTYETPAEIRFLRTVGGDAVGMSTVPEVIAANHGGMKVLGLSCITNQAAGTTGQKLSHEEVVAVGRMAQDKMIALLGSFVSEVTL